MDRSAEDDGRLLPIQEYFRFTKGLWGATANVSLFFPFSVQLTDLTQVDAKYATLCSVLCAGCILLVWAGRTDSWLYEIRGGRILNLAVVSTVALLLGGVLVAMFFLLGDAGAGESTLALALYLAGFAAITAGFGGLGLKEYFVASGKPPFAFREMADRVVALHLKRVARDYLRCRVRDLRVVSRSDGDPSGDAGTVLRVRHEGDEYELVVSGTGHIASFRPASPDAAAAR